MKGIAKALRELLDGDVPDFVKWTDADWEDQDARVHEARLREAADPAAAARRELLSTGWAERVLDSAANADERQPAITFVKSWGVEANSALVLSGPIGSGKTTAAAWWAMHRRPSTRFLRAAEFATMSRYDAEARQRWADARALVLDDLGTEYLDAKGSFLVDLDELVDRFYAHRRPLLITTNCTRDEFRRRYGERVYDRLRECGAWKSASGESLRRRRSSR